MSRRRLIIALTLLAGFTGTAAAESPAQMWSDFKKNYYRNVYWTRPFIYSDRARTMAPFAVMEANGWRRHNLLGSHHFKGDASEMSEAGRLKVHWILTQAPAHRRMLFVERSVDPATTAARIDAVQRLAADIVPQGELPGVQTTHLISEGHPAAVVDRLNVQFRETAPPPQLKPEDSAGEDF